MALCYHTVIFSIQSKPYPMSRWLSALFTALARKLLFLFVRTHVIPEDLSQLRIDPDKPVCYVLQTRFFSNLLVLDQEAHRRFRGGRSQLFRAAAPARSPATTSVCAAAS